MLTLMTGNAQNLVIKAEPEVCSFINRTTGNVQQFTNTYFNLYYTFKEEGIYQLFASSDGITWDPTFPMYRCGGNHWPVVGQTIKLNRESAAMKYLVTGFDAEDHLIVTDLSGWHNGHFMQRFYQLRKLY